MNLLALKNEALAHGFDPTSTSDRLVQYLNDAMFHVARRVNFYENESTETIATTAGSSTVPFPADFMKERSLVNTDTDTELQYVSLRDIDRSPVNSGTPEYFAVDGANLHLYPTPNAATDLLLRYWKLPTTLVADGDVPSIPSDYHRLLWMWAVMEAYAAEDDPQTAGYWKGRFDELLAEFEADQRFPAEGPTQLRSMWDQEQGLGTVWTPWGY